MLTVRRSNERGHNNLGWLDTYHSFSFSHYYDPNFMGFRSLRVLNEDRVTPGQGFGTHPHDNMEIITYVIEGSIAHKDSMGNGSTIVPGDVQRMTAGTGITHSEFNPSPKDPLHLIQIWIIPEKRGLTPGYEQKSFPPSERASDLKLIGSRDGREGSVTIHQDVSLYAGLLEGGDSRSVSLAPGRHAWVQVVKGDLTVNGQSLSAGDAVAASDETQLTLSSKNGGEVLVFDLA